MKAELAYKCRITYLGLPSQIKMILEDVLLKYVHIKIVAKDKLCKELLEKCCFTLSA